MCHECYPACKECHGAKLNDCDKCFENHYLYDGECVNPCPAGTFKNGSTGTCDDCEYPCETCTNNDSHCLSCEEAHFLHEH